jgi:hypothetical protein
LLLCEDCEYRFIASNQHGYQCATRTYGGLSACGELARRVYEKGTREAQSAPLLRGFFSGLRR